MPIEAGKFTVIFFNVYAVTIIIIGDQPLATDVALYFHCVRAIKVINALAVCGYIDWISPIGQRRATVTAINCPINTMVVFFGVRAGCDTFVVIEVPAPAVGPACVRAHPVQVLAPIHSIKLNDFDKYMEN